MNVGILGCGNISGQYLRTLSRSRRVRVAAVADLRSACAEARAAEFGVPRVLGPEELLQDPEIDAVLNLTTPRAHFETSLAAIRAGKHVFTEKPLCETPAQARTLLAEADRFGLRVGAAPDTVLGHGIQTARAAFDAGGLGPCHGGHACWVAPGHEAWHPDPEFYYKPGGGPALDMGPYYIAALVTILGPVAAVVASAEKTRPTRTIASGPKRGQTIEVDVPTHTTGLLRFTSGATLSFVLSFDTWATCSERIELYARHGTMTVPDPNGFDGPTRVFDGRREDRSWAEVPAPAGVVPRGRGAGLVEMADAIREKRPHRCSGAFALHVLDVLFTIERSAAEGRWLDIPSAADRPPPLDPAWTV